MFSYAVAVIYFHHISFLSYQVCDPVTIINQNGTITSPLYPSPYPKNAFCEWYLSAPEENYLLLQIQEFETKRSYDYLTIGEGSTIDFSQALYRFSGILGVDEDIPAKILSPSESIWVVFESSAMSNTLTGFSIDVSIVKQGKSSSCFYPINISFLTRIINDCFKNPDTMLRAVWGIQIADTMFGASLIIHYVDILLRASLII